MFCKILLPVSVIVLGSCYQQNIWKQHLQTASSVDTTLANNRTTADKPQDNTSEHCETERLSGGGQMTRYIHHGVLDREYGHVMTIYATIC